MTTLPAFWHLLFEIAAYSIGAQIYWRTRRRDPLQADRFAQIGIVAGLVLGAAAGSKMAYWFEHPQYAFQDFPSLVPLLAGKSIVGGLLGGLIGVEWAKRLQGITQSTGDALIWPLAIGIGIGRIGCFLAGLSDATYGNPTSVPWAINFGDGIPRHPTQLYEIAALLTLAWVVTGPGARLAQIPGDRFKLFLAAYLAWRLVIDTIKPVPYEYWPGLSGIQWLCLAGLLYYSRHLFRMLRPWATR
ncbi:MAG: prolipoprotein diacylglyceryl transferase [Ahniella sp.]|nr:prolipoprotein diacylglyceryl transferase [Ahniella sp.]